MDEDDRELLSEMRRYASQARQWAAEGGTDWTKDAKTVAAVAHVVGQVGEAARHVSPATQSEDPAVAWRAIIAMRHRIYHDYGGLKIERLAAIVLGDLPDLVNELDRILAEA